MGSAYVSFTAMDSDESPTVAASGSDTSLPKCVTVVEQSQWQEDTIGCTICSSEFGGVMNRRHHCRMCGKCVCHDCSPNVLQMKGKLERVCNPCVLNGAGALELLPALHHLRDELCSFNSHASPLSISASLPPAQHPAQAVGECVAAAYPLRKTFQMIQEQAESSQKRSQVTVEAEVEVTQRERRAQALADACKSKASERTALSKELAQERKKNQETEAQMGQLLEGMRQLDRMLKDMSQSKEESKLETRSEDDASEQALTPKPASEESTESEPTEHLKNFERVLTSCTLSAGVWLHRRRGSGKPVPVLSRMLGGRDTTPRTTTPTDSARAESSDSSGSEPPTPRAKDVSTGSQCFVTTSLT